MNGSTRSFANDLKEAYKTLCRRVDPAYADFFWIKPMAKKTIPAVTSEVDSAFTIQRTRQRASRCQVCNRTVVDAWVVCTTSKLLGATVLLAIVLLAAKTAAMSARERDECVSYVR